MDAKKPLLSHLKHSLVATLNYLNEKKETKSKTKSVVYRLLASIMYIAYAIKCGYDQ